ncbi:MAG: cardiolipin synthase ClsB [Aquabacterium sp.]|nr:cardiolipin synthase ClsB [Aquabacterium sp.]
MSDPTPPDADGPFDKLGWYAQRKPVFTGGNQVRLLKGGEALFPAVIEAITQAQSSIWMAIYMVSPQGQSGAVLQAVMRAAKRGVSVHLLVDAFGSGDAPETLWDELRKAGVQLVAYRPLHKLWGLLDIRTWRRMHMKLCVIDGQHGFVGGINLIDDRFDTAHGWVTHPRLDYSVQAQGPVVLPVLHTIKAVWARATLGRDWRDDLAHLAKSRRRVQHVRRWLQHARMKLTPTEQQQQNRAASTAEPMRVAFVLRDNLMQRRTIEQSALQAILQARQRIDIVTPYFYPKRAIRLALRSAASRGIKVRLLLQGKLDYPIAGLAARVLYAELQHDGVRIFEYQPAFLHAKVLCVDDEWATVGSSNLDPLSLALNLEANLIIKDRLFVRALSASLNEDFAQSREIPHPSLTPVTLGARVRRGFIRWLAKAYLRLAGVTGRY